MRSMLVALAVLLAASSNLGICGAASAGPEKGQICKVHHTKLVPRRVRIAYGLMAGPPEEFSRARAARFPNGVGTAIPGGCTPMSERFTTIRSCPVCDRTMLAWCRTHQNIRLPVVQPSVD
jgi:hypothetical protein